MNCSDIEKMNPPRSTRLYLHPPLSERLVLIYPDFKITDLELCETKTHTGQCGSGVWLLHGTDMQMVDYKNATFDTVQGGFPRYRLRSGNPSGTVLTMEAFCNFERIPTTYVRVCVTNQNNYAITDSVGILPRSAKNDNQMVGCVTTGYSSYRPNFRNWLTFVSRFAVNGETATDGCLSLRFNENVWHWVSRAEQPVQHEAYDYFRTDFSLEPGESISFDFCMTAGTLPDNVAYDAECAEAEKRWNEELAPMNLTPATKSPRIQSMYRHLAAQCLQMLARYTDSDLITPRQGDIGRYVWPWEAANMLTALDRIGLTRYTGEAYRYFIEKWLVREGENRGKIMSNHQQWGNLNGSLLWGIGEHLLYTKNAEEFAFFKPYLDMILEWVERERHRGDNDPNCRYKGIFPVGKGSDWTELAQHWTFTDGQNLLGLESMLSAYEYFHAENLAWVKSCRDSYKAVMEGILQSLCAGHENDESFLPPHQLGLPFEDTLTYCYYLSGAPYLIYTGLIPSDSHLFEQMERYCEEHGMFEHGLAGRMTNLSSTQFGLYGDVYYTVNGEVIWIKAWVERGEREKADAMMRSLLRFGVTSEFIVSERYSPLDEWYSPWQPNASSSGRMLHILLDYYGEQKN